MISACQRHSIRLTKKNLPDRRTRLGKAIMARMEELQDQQQMSLRQRHDDNNLSRSMLGSQSSLVYGEQRGRNQQHQQVYHAAIPQVVTQRPSEKKRSVTSFYADDCNSNGDNPERQLLKTESEDDGEQTTVVSRPASQLDPDLRERQQQEDDYDDDNEELKIQQESVRISTYLSAQEQQRKSMLMK